ncbi:MAG: hypothetical protein AMXMBFR23_01080 [Chloroflexota bacterium]
MTLRITWYTTRGASSRAMFEVVLGAIRAGTLDAEIACVFSNRERGEEGVTDAFFDLVQSEGLPLLSLSSVRFRRERGGQRSQSGAPLPAWREEYDAAVAALVDGYPSDLGVLAGYMLIFTPGFVAGHPLLNLHPALPGGPVGTWREVIRRLIRDRAAESGVMVHLAIPEVDEGPVAAFCRYPLTGAAFDPLWAALPANLDDDAALETSPLFARIREEMVRHEAPFLVSALQAFADGRLRLAAGRLVAGSGGAPFALDLTEDVRARL